MQQKGLLNRVSDVSLPSSDDIDSKDIIIALWKGKLIIAVVTFVCAAIAVVYALTAKQVWTTQSLIAYPQGSDFSDYRQMVSDYQPIFDIYQDDGTVLISHKLDDIILPKTLFDIFIQQFESRANKKAYIGDNVEFQRELNQVKADVQGSTERDVTKQESRLYNEWFAKLAADHEANQYTLQGQLSTADDSYAFLSGYIDFVAEKSRSIAVANFYSVVASKRSEIMQQQALFTDQARSRLLNERAQAQYALEIALAAGLDKPQQNLNSEDLFAINIGADALAAKVKVLGGLTQLSIIEPRLHQLNAKFDLLNNLTINPDVVFNTFQFIESPEKPISRTSPKRPLIAIFGALFGGILGAIIVLIRAFLPKKED
ncbi:Wzz/FepE/Etk N-terminal domain-containing protein [Marinomonas primoryensis]|jgi:chain length determinant protein (polysaccharide antigen chain regulator)|uniref:Wzz/FepE/Etk N-terminal domain-containing protein n=1 Tax=Marinomonas primoryensis TaxID=178399 RepID=UPI00370401AB